MSTPQQRDACSRFIPCREGSPPCGAREYRRAVRAVVFDRYGPPDVLRLEERDRPVPADDQVLIRVRATSVTRTDVGLRSADIPISRFVTGLLRPKPANRVLGMEVAGTVD